MTEPNKNSNSIFMNDQLITMLEQGIDIYDLSQALENGMPCSPNHPGFKMALMRRHGDHVRPDGLSAANELIVMGGHVGTHIDALSHVSHQGCLHGDINAEDTQRGGRFSSLGVEEISPMICRGILLDIAGLHNESILKGGYGITAQDLEEASKLEGVELKQGDVCLVRTGWAKHWRKGDKYIGYESGVPGLTEAAGKWCVERGVRAVGGDTSALEQVLPHEGHRLLPVHRLLLVEHGIYIIEHLMLEELADKSIYQFLFILVPLKIIGATGSPVRPLAIVENKNLPFKSEKNEK